MIMIELNYKEGSPIYSVLEIESYPVDLAGGVRDAWFPIRGKFQFSTAQEAAAALTEVIQRKHREQKAIKPFCRGSR